MADWSAAWRTWWGNGYHKIPRRLPPGQGSAPAANGSKRPAYWWRSAAVRADTSDEDWRELVAEAEHASGGAWSVPDLGPPPGSPGCVVPPAVLRSMLGSSS
jgi:hypothetical protein